ncbi:hypothetical protein ACFYXS_37650 [Streptomyces sp. NPDC002574]|uniref:hypothetical protein n=1 Tax=Streptomyces sp. NPDC002574 TaxID=3364652 RepID=UPI0036B1D4CF
MGAHGGGHMLPALCTTQIMSWDIVSDHARGSDLSQSQRPSPEQRAEVAGGRRL